MASNNNHTDTYRWDTVYALHIKEINKIIEQSAVSPPDFSYSGEDGWSAKASFGVWQIDNGGDGKLLHFSLPIKQGILINEAKEYPFKNANVIFELELAFFDSTEQPSEGQSGRTQNLKAKTTASNEGSKVATVIGIEFADKDASFLLKALLPTAIEGWLNQNLTIFDHIFASVNLNNSIDEGKFEWVTPTAVDYAFIGNEDKDKSLLGILCMTENRSPNGLNPQVSPFVIPDTSEGGFLIANNRCLEKLVKPAIPLVFKNFNLDDLELSSDQNSLQLKPDKSINIPMENDGKTYDCDLQVLNISIKESYIEIHFKAKTDIAIGIESHVESIHKYNIITKTKADGQQTLDFSEIGEPVVNKWTTQPTGVLIAEIVLSVIAAILFIILTILTDGAILIVGALIIGILVGAAVATPQILELVGKDDAPDMNLLISNTTSPINWTRKGKFNLNQSRFNGCLQLGGIYPQ